MLGLTSPYLMISTKMFLRSAVLLRLMDCLSPGIPGSKKHSITKGAGSVVNGYESISGQINTELLKPVNDVPFPEMPTGSTDSRFELNTHFNTKISDKWASSLFVHGNARTGKNGMNEDGFLDNPLGKQINVLNRWRSADTQKGWVGREFWLYERRKANGRNGF